MTKPAPAAGADEPARREDDNDFFGTDDYFGRDRYFTDQPPSKEETAE